MSHYTTGTAPTTTSATNLKLRQRDLLRIYAYYRVVIALVLLGLFVSGLSKSTVGTLMPALYLNTAFIYTVLNCGWLLHLRRSGYLTTAGQVGFILGTDILAFLLLIQSSGGLNSGVGYLLLTTCSVGSLLLDRRMSAFLAAVASIAVIGQQLFGMLSGRADTQDIVSAGSLGILLFTSVSALQYLSAHIRMATRRAEQQSRQAAHLQRLAQEIIAQMRTGIVVLDTKGRPELINRAAQQMLGAEWLPDGNRNDRLRRALQAQPHQPGNSQLIRGAEQSELRTSFTTLPRGQGDSTLVFIEDNRKLAQQAQQLKLASLGRLTGSIAHEIRNPLGAISHAAQLLSESPGITNQDRQLTDIICRQSLRVNQIVENVMQLSRRRAAEPQLLDLSTWLKHFISDYRLGAPSDAQIELELAEQPIIARFDPQQLIQIATNLINNALHHSHAASGKRAVKIVVGEMPQRGCAQLDIIDYGHGIAEEHRDKIFEPFFTTENSGAGLGLYIARELCEAIQANLYFCRTTDHESCFRVEFANPKRIF